MAQRGSDRSDFTGTNILPSPPVETPRTVVTSTSTRERIVMSTTTSWRDHRPTDSASEPPPELDFNPPPSFQVVTETAPPVVIIVGTILSSVTLSARTSSPSLPPSAVQTLPSTALRSTPSISTSSPITQNQSQSTGTSTNNLSSTIPAPTSTSTQGPALRPLVVPPEEKPADKGGGPKLSSETIGGIGAAVGLVLISALVVWAVLYLRRRKQCKMPTSTLPSQGNTILPTTNLPPTGSEQAMMTAHDSEARLLSRTDSPGPQASSWGHPGTEAPRIAMPEATSFMPDHRGYYASLSTVVEPPTPSPFHRGPSIPAIIEPQTQLSMPSAPYIRPTSSYYPPHGEEAPHAQRLDNPIPNYAVSAYRDAGNPFCTPFKPATLTVPKSSHVASMFSGKAPLDDGASYYSGWFNDGGSGASLLGSGVSVVRANNELYGSIMKACEAPTAMGTSVISEEGRLREEQETEGEWYKGPEPSAQQAYSTQADRSLTGSGSGSGSGYGR